MRKISLWIITNILRFYLWLTLRIDGAEEVAKIPADRGVILILNHTGQVEVPILATLLQPRKITAWGKAEAFEIPFLRWVFGAWEVVPIHRGEADMAALKSALRMLKEKYLFAIAPEGTRNKTGILRRGLPGAAILALRSNAPVVPIVHWGGEVFLRNLKRLKRTDFHIRVGEPFLIKVEGKVNAETRQEIADEMMYRIAELMPPKYRGEYGDLSKATGKYFVKAE
ncbi:MAG: 1-acyl-sn-glycerol-3-phosphate acyltransferase [Anaerolineales bacterium]|nr:1-acyl-sn-glycerol-3-phosphate acyltransferase [Anaerolineales bacterium]